MLTGCTEYASMDYTYDEYSNSQNSATSNTDRNQNNQHINTSESKTDPIYLEVQFGNGEVLRAEVIYFMLPKSSNYEYSTMNGGWEYCEGYTTAFYNQENFSGVDADPDHVLSIPEPSLAEKLKLNKLSTAGAVLLNGMIYNFHEAYTASVNEATRTVHISVWRNQPYELEYQYFEKVN